jgi:hypothetical protein
MVERADGGTIGLLCRRLEANERLTGYAMIRSVVKRAGVMPASIPIEDLNAENDE